MQWHVHFGESRAYPIRQRIFMYTAGPQIISAVQGRIDWFCIHKPKYAHYACLLACTLQADCGETSVFRVVQCTLLQEKNSLYQ